MQHAFTLFGSASAAFAAIMNPIANTPIFLSLTQDLDAKQARNVAFRSIALAFVIVASFTLAGGFLLHLFGITLPAFRIAGGLLVALVAYHLLQGGHSPVHKLNDADMSAAKDAEMDIAVSPLGMPLLAGPGTIVTGMSYAAGGTAQRVGIVLAAFVLICFVTYGCFMCGRRLTGLVGTNVVAVISRLMGLILSVIGTQMVIEGIMGVAKGGPN